MRDRADLLERGPERGQLAELMASARSAHGQLAVVTGPAGIGKTRLLAQIRADASVAGMLVLTATGSDLETDFAFGVVRQLFEPLLFGQSRRSDLLEGAAAAAAPVFDLGEPAAPGDVSYAMLHGLYWLTTDLCADRPLLLCIDDLQWCDAPSLRFLTHLLPQLAELPLLVAVGVRQGEPAAYQYLLDQLTWAATVLRIGPLSPAGSATLARSLLSTEPDDEFLAACHRGTGGNPLLVREWVTLAVEEHVPPTGSGAARLAHLAPRSISRRVARQLERLGPSAATLAEAVAVLGEAEPALAAAVAGVGQLDAVELADQLAEARILESRPPLRFVHPLVRAAVVQAMPAPRLHARHAAAARLLTERGADPERAAAHLLLVLPPAPDGSVTVLRHASERAAERGSPEAAVRYLERALQEPLSAAERVDLLNLIGPLAMQIDISSAVPYLRSALELATETERRAVTAGQLAHVLLVLGNTGESQRVAAEAIELLPPEHADFAQRLHADLVSAMMYDPALRKQTMQRWRELRAVEPTTGPGGRMLDCFVAMYGMLTVSDRHDAETRARRALSDGVIADQFLGAQPWVSGLLTLFATDLDAGMKHVDEAVAMAHRRGSIFALASSKYMRGLGWLWQGDLAEAEADMRDAVRGARASSFRSADATGSFLAYVLIEQGNLTEAERELDATWSDPVVPAVGMWWWYQYGRGLLLLAQQRWAEAVRMMLDCGERYTAHGFTNPVFIPWRSYAALGLAALGRDQQARELAHEELDLARAWGEARSIGRALRVCGQVEPGRQCTELLAESVHVLESSSARLEYAKSLVAHGAALRAAGDRDRARDQLTHGLHHAYVRGAEPVVTQARAELRLLGARPRRPVLSGIESLTPSERRVVELAAVGTTNRKIAETLFVTVKTVESHLASSYRKLGVSRREDLARIGAGNPEAR